jgi:hypothetical protein
MSLPKYFIPTQTRFVYYISPSELGKRLGSCWSKENSCGPQGYILGKGGDIVLINGFYTCQPIRVRISLSKVTFIFQLSNRIFMNIVLKVAAGIMRPAGRRLCSTVPRYNSARDYSESCILYYFYCSIYSLQLSILFSCS